MVRLMRRLREEFTALPGLRLNEPQVQRLCNVNAATAASALRALVSAGFLDPLKDGHYRRADTTSGIHARCRCEQSTRRRNLQPSLAEA